MPNGGSESARKVREGLPEEGKLELTSHRRRRNESGKGLKEMFAWKMELPVKYSVVEENVEGRKN